MTVTTAGPATRTAVRASTTADCAPGAFWVDESPVVGCVPLKATAGLACAASSAVLLFEINEEIPDDPTADNPPRASSITTSSDARNNLVAFNIFFRFSPAIL
jgi:hypothetical protein